MNTDNLLFEVEECVWDHGTLLLDASTVDLLSRHQIYHALTGDYFAKPKVADILEGILRQHAKTGTVRAKDRDDLYGLTHALSFLEQWVLADRVVVDVKALMSIHTASNPSGNRNVAKIATLFSVVEIPDEINSKAASNVANFYDQVRNGNDTIFSYDSIGMADVDLCLKDKFYSKLNASLSVSANIPARAIFYLEASKLLGVPLLLHPQKSIHLKKIGAAACAHILRTYPELTGKIKDKFQYCEADLPIPPIADEIIRVARQEECSLVDAARNIHETTEIRSLRSLMRKLATISLRDGPIAYQRKIDQEGRTIARSIEARLSTHSIISRRKVNLAQLPWIGPVLEAFGVAETDIFDLVLGEPRYIALFNRWANEVA